MTTTIATQTTASLVQGTFKAVIEGFRVLRARRAQRLALATLLEMDPGRLDDLGISVQDVREALSAPRPAGPRLEARRSARARSWSPKTVSA